MTIDFRKMTVLLVFLSSSLSASSLTFLIDTREEMPRADMEMEQRIKVVSVETGIMDTFFDKGHIFFNIYSLRNRSTWEEADIEALKYAADEGADFLLVLAPGDEGASWSLFRVSGLSHLGEGSVSIGETNPEMNTGERWTALGIILAEAVVSLIN